MSTRRPVSARGLTLGLLLLAATGLACPVGCPELPAPYPRGSRDGFHRIDVNGYPVFKDWLVYDERARTFVVIDEICKGRVKSFEVYFRRLLRTVNE